MNPTTDSLVLYKIRPARVLSVGEKIMIELEGGQVKNVRPKDIELLHPGPLLDLSDLAPQEGDIEEAWALLEGNTTNLAELSELIYADFTPITAWATWKQVANGLFFSGRPQTITVRSRAMVERDQQERAAREAERRNYKAFITRLQANTFLPEDHERLKEVEKVAFGYSENSRILKTLGHQATKEHAYRFLTKLGYWPPHYNPYPARCQINLSTLELPIPELPEDTRRDLTHLTTYAIDNADTQDPDDAISIDGNCLWVHIADVAALVAPDSQLDHEARARGANLYLPEGVVPMLPHKVTHNLGLGLQNVSPALSFGIQFEDIDNLESINPDTIGNSLGNTKLEICHSWIQAQRISYQEAETKLDSGPLYKIHQITEAFYKQRQAQGTVNIELPEVNIKLRDNIVHIIPVEKLQSRELVANAMLLAGETIARYCQQANIPIPYVVQPPPDQPQNPTDLAAMWAYRKQLKPSRLSVEPDLHFGLGLPMYTRATSPLRRYSDLLVHQQICAHLDNKPLLSEEQIAERFDLADIGSSLVRRAERLSNTHWKLVWLIQHSEWEGDAIVLEQEQDRVWVTIPELALETKVRIQGTNLNDQLNLKLREVDLPELACYFNARIK